jgi:hypothetical protein
MTPSLVLMPMEVEPNYDKCLTKKGVTYFDRLDSILNLVDSTLGVESVNTLRELVVTRQYKLMRNCTDRQKLLFKKD